MDAYVRWLITVQKCRDGGFQVLPLDERFTEARLAELANLRYDEKPPPLVAAFARLWKEYPTDPGERL